MDELTIVDTETGEARTGAVLPLTDGLLECLDAADKTSSVTFDATCDFEAEGVLESAIADALDDAGPSEAYAIILPADEEVGYVYTASEFLPAPEDGDWLVRGSTSSELASLIRGLI